MPCPTKPSLLTLLPTFTLLTLTAACGGILEKHGGTITQGPQAGPNSSPSPSEPSGPSSSPANGSLAGTPPTWSPSLVASGAGSTPVDARLTQGAFLTSDALPQWPSGVASSVTATTVGSDIGTLFWPGSNNFYLDTCETTAFNQMAVQASGSVALTSGTSADFSACETASGDDQVTSSVIQVFWAVQCPGMDLSALNGQPGLKVPSGIATNSVCPYARMTLNYQEKKVYTYGTGNTAMTTTTVKTFSKMAAAGGPCVYTMQGAQLMLDGCQVSSSVVSTTLPLSVGLPPSYSISTALYHQTTLSPSSVMYNSGSVAFTDDDWHGTMTFYGGNPTAPWTATGPQGQQASGTNPLD